MTLYLDKLIAGNNLTRHESYTLFSQMATYPLSSQAEILNIFAKKKETAEELLGAMEALLEHSVSIDYPHEVVDIVGTGGDGLKTFNISTAASLVVASCGVTVAKHGGRRVTSLSGSTDVLAALGVPMPQTANASITLLKTQGYTYLWAPLFNPLLSAFGEVRKQLGIPTILNTLGPLLNPIRPKRQVLGVYSQHLVPTIAQVLKASGLDHALVVHSEDGLDELSMSAPTHIAELRNGFINQYRITPEEVGLKSAPLQDVIGGDSTENANIIRDLFSGKINDAKLDIVLLNSAAGLLVANQVATLKEGVELARSAIASGLTAAFLHTLQSTSIRGQS
ncbi:MAG: anthranilate phosphoribosyltransferase [Legionella sp.]|nr:MAG: anthranilate phosphoribosyltransferase [Legionella sp.]